MFDDRGKPDEACTRALNSSLNPCSKLTWAEFITEPLLKAYLG